MQNKAIETLIAEGINEYDNGIYKMAKCVTLKKSEGIVIDGLLIFPHESGVIMCHTKEGYIIPFRHLSFTDRLRIARKVFHHISRITEKR